MKRFLIAAILALCALVPKGPDQAIAAATLLPPGENCFQATTGTTGMVGALGTITGGSGGTTGTYGGVSLTGGSGSGATANITVAGGAVTAVTILNPGTAYVVGNTLSAASGSIGNVTGFSVPVASVAINSSLAGGSVAFYVPNTLTPKQTWTSATQATQNTNPVLLDQNGCAIIYGIGTYRQVLKDSLGNTVWDQLTTDTSANNNTFWAGTSAGTPNVITVTDPGFNGTDGSIIQFIANQTNTAAATLNPSGYGALPIQKDTSAGPVALSGGEIVQGNVINVVWNSVTGSFHLLNTVIASASGASAPLCGATGLIITNGATPNSLVSLTANSVVMVSNAGLVINRSNVSLPIINTTLGNVTSTANGMDGEVPGTSQWLNVWAIDNGAAAAGLISTSATAPTMPSGYNYKCRLGTMRVDGSGNLLRAKQAGSRWQYVVTSGSNVPNMPLVCGSAAGAGVWTACTVSTFVPPTATAINVVVHGIASSFIAAAPNNNYGFNGSNTNPPPLSLNLGAGPVINTSGALLLESTNIYIENNSASNSIFAAGYKDNVNAN